MRSSYRNLFVGAIVALATIASAQSPAPAKSVTTDIVYGHKAGMALTYDVFAPHEPNGAAVLFIVSGGWRSVWRPPEQMVGRFAFLLDRGFTVYTVRHGSSPWFRIPEMVEDVRRAVRHVAAHAAEHGVDARRLGLFGGSAGGQLALMIAMTADDGDPDAGDPVLRTGDRVRSVVAWYPPVDLRGFVPTPSADGTPPEPNERFPALNFDPDLADDMSPIVHVTKDDPPTLFVHGDRDRLVPLTHSTRMKAALEDAGVRTELMVVEGAGHGFRGDSLERVKQRMLEWFEATLLD